MLARRDHHLWRENEVKEFAQKAQKSGAGAIVTTEKDAVKMQASWGQPLPLWSLVIQLNLCDGAAKLLSLLESKIENKGEQK
jgi:tetraacyldisaccharide-1-P 4'-kinase